MLFHEIYSTYFQTVAKILAEAVEHPLTTEEISAIIQDCISQIQHYLSGFLHQLFIRKQNLPTSFVS